MKVIKRDGRAVEYNSEKIRTAIEKANKEVVEEKRATNDEIGRIISYIESVDKKRILVEDIQDIIEQKLMELGRYDLAKKYIVYRYTRALVRKQNTTDESILGLIKNVNGASESSYANTVTASVQRNLIAGEVSKDLTKRILLPEKIAKAHEDGIIYFHATEYFLQPILNSAVINIGDMLDNGMTINNQKIEQPDGFLSACITLAQIVGVVSNSQYGEQYIYIRHLGKYVRMSYKRFKAELEEMNDESLSDDAIREIAEERLKYEISHGVQIIRYQIGSIMNAYRSSPMVGLILDNDATDEYYEENQMVISEILKCNIENCEYITDLSTTQRYKDECFFNYGIVSINLPQIALSIDESENEFWHLLDERLELCYEALMCRHYALLGTISDVSPIHWQNGAIARLQQGERIDRFLKDGCSSLILGYVGLTETEELMGSLLNWNEVSKGEFRTRLVKYLEDRTQTWKKMSGLGFAVEEMVETDANYRLYCIDKDRYGKALNLFGKGSY